MRNSALWTLFAALLLVGCGQTPSKVVKVNDPDSENGDSRITTGKGEIVKPPEVPEVPPSPEEAAVAKLSTAELLDELGKPHSREVASKILAAKGSAVVPDLVTALKHEDWQVRAGAVFTLGRLGKDAESALPDLKKLHESEPNDTVKDAIPYCLDAIAGK